jgi:hypothetical protein
MLRKIAFLLIALFIGATITAASSQVKTQGLRWFVPERGGCGNHWGGLPFSYRHMYLYDDETPNNVRIQCVGVGRPLPLFIDWFIWSFAVFATLQSTAKIMRIKLKKRS